MISIGSVARSDRGVSTATAGGWAEAFSVCLFLCGVEGGKESGDSDAYKLFWWHAWGPYIGRTERLVPIYRHTDLRFCCAWMDRSASADALRLSLMSFILSFLPFFIFVILCDTVVLYFSTLHFRSR